MVDDALPAKKEIKITADSRYKLYINGKFVQEGATEAPGSERMVC